MKISRTFIDWAYSLVPLSDGRDLIIVAGMPKSGTTAIAKLLGAAIGKKVCSDPFYRLDLQGIEFREALFEGRLSLRHLWRSHRRDFSGTIIKDPNFPLLLGQVRDLFPEARLVSIVRDPRDNIRSVLNRLGLPGDPEGIHINGRSISPTWRSILSGTVPRLPSGDYVEVLAWRWRRSAEAFLGHRDACMEIRYEDFREDKARQIGLLAARLGYSAVSDITHLVDVQYQPKGDATTSWHDFFGDRQLEKIERITGPLLKAFGYGTLEPCS